MVTLYCRHISRSFPLVALVASLTACQQADDPSARLSAEILRVQSHLSPSIDALLAYEKQYGRFPAVLSDLHIDLPNISRKAPKGSVSTGTLQYEVARDGSFARAFFQVGDEGDYEVASTALFDTRARKWTEVSFLHRLSYEEAQHFGRSFQADGSEEQLDLAVASLIDSARTNNHPCRNLWQGWVSEALGPKSTASATESEMNADAKIVEYRSSNGHTAYRFTFQKGIYPPIHKPLTTVSAIYRSERSQHWRLVQPCDSSATQ